MPIFVTARWYYICCKPKEIFAKENFFHEKLTFKIIVLLLIKMGLSGLFEQYWPISLTILWYWR